MLWKTWLKAMFSGKEEWRIVYLPEQELTEFVLEDGELVLNNKHFYLEKPTWIHAVIWAVESITYGTSLKFWKWKEFQGLTHVAAL